MTFTPSTFSYNNNLPNPPDYPGNDVGGMQVNTQSLQQIIDVDHVDFTVNGAGWHNKVTFPDVYTVTGPAPINNVCALYPRAGTNGPDLVFQNRSGIFSLGLGTLTSNGVVGPPPTWNGTFVASGGLIFKWGNNTVTNSGTVITFPTPFPNSCFGVQYSYNFTPANATTTVTGNFPTVSGITLRLNGGSASANVFWLAIGL
jgi:hypothetical protein